MVIEKIFFGIIGVLIIWVMVPHLRRHEYIAPNPLPPDSWITNYGGERAQALSYPPGGYGFRRFDFWNDAPATGRPATREDFQLRW